jgi:hypothetical protein
MPSSSAAALIHPSDSPLSFPDIRIKIGELLPEAMYDGLPQLMNAYVSHSYNRGYGVVLGYKGKVNKLGNRTIYWCDRSGKPRDRKNKNLDPSRKRANTGSRCCDCPFKIEAQELPGGRWRGRVLNEYHNHTASEETTSHPAHRKGRLDNDGEVLVKQLLSRATPVSTILEQVHNQFGLRLKARDIYNLRAEQRRIDLVDTTAIQWLVETLGERDFFVAIDTAKDNPDRVTRLFFAHPESIKLLAKYPDVILMDCTYKTNRFNMPLLNFCGTAGNNMTPQTCLAFLSGEKEDDYTWALNCYRKMLAQHDIAEPKCFVTDRELALLNALDKLFPASDHILCRWHVNMNVVAKCKRNLKTKEAFQEFYEAWSTVVESETLEAYDENLASFKKLNTTAVNYCVKTWLVWREKLVCLMSKYVFL